jgi:hypothetical protein
VQVNVHHHYFEGVFAMIIKGFLLISVTKIGSSDSLRDTIIYLVIKIGIGDDI